MAEREHETEGAAKAGAAKGSQPAAAAAPPRRIDLLGRVAFAAYMVVGGVFVFGFGRTLTSAVATQNENPCRSLAPRHARLTGTVLDEAGNPLAKAEVVPVLDGRAGAPVAAAPDGTFSVHMPKGPQAVRVRAPGRAELEASLGAHMKAINQGLDPHEQLDCIVLTTDPWTVDNDLVTPTFKVKRNRIETLFAARYEQWVSARKPVLWYQP